MDCQQVKELLDAYALGAAEKGEASALEEHVADCVRCWDELNEAQRTAALLSLAVPIERAPAALRARIVARAEQEGRQERFRFGLRQLFWRGWPAAAGGLAVAAAAALALAVFLQVQVNDLRGENSQLELEVRDSSRILDGQRQLMAVLSAPDMQELPMSATAPDTQALAVYYWSKSTKMGFLVGNNLPDLEEGQVYQVWFTQDGEAVAAGAFEPWQGTGQLAMDLTGLDGPPAGIGISIEEAGGSAWPTGEMFLYADVPRR